MFSSLRKANKKLLREVYLLARCLILNWSRRHAFTYARKTWNLLVIFYSFSKVFAEKKYKKYSTASEEWIESETATLEVIMY